MGRSYNIDEVSRLTGLERSRIRFIEKAFAEYFDTSEYGLTGQQFDDRQVSILSSIDGLLSREGLDIPAVRARLARLARLAAASRPAVRIIAVTSGKGGVGKTFVSVNLAIALKQFGRRTLLVDADFGLANVHVLTGIRPTRTILDLLSGDVAAHDITTKGPGGIEIVCGASGVSELADVAPDVLEFAGRELERIAAGFDFLIVDTAAGISSRVLHFLRAADDILVVATPNTASILDAYGVIKSAVERSVRGQIGLLMNRVTGQAEANMVFDNISSCSERFLDMRPRRLGHLLDDPLVEDSIRARSPFVLNHPNSANSSRLRSLAAGLAATRTSDRSLRAADAPLGELFRGLLPRAGGRSYDRRNDQTALQH